MTRRIIVALDESAASLAALQEAARLAGELSAEILGVFVEDVDLFSAAGLPGSATVSYQAASVLPLGPELLTRSLRIRARHLRETLARIATANRVAWRFETIRGNVSEEILRLAAESEMIALGTVSARDRRGALGSTARAVIERARCSVMVVHRSLPPAQRILVLTSGSGEARRIGEGLARITGAPITIRQAPEDRGAALDLLMRLAPAYLVIDRGTLARLDLQPRELAERLKVEGIVVTD